MRYLLSILTILAIIVTVWYTKHLSAQHEQTITSLNAQLETVQSLAEPKINKMDSLLKEAYDTLDLEETTFRNKLDTLTRSITEEFNQQERTAHQNADRVLRHTLANRELTAKEWETTLGTFKSRREEIAKLLTQNNQQIVANNQKLADIIKQDTTDIANREDTMRRSARAAVSSGKAGGRATSYAIIDAKEAMEKKHRNMTRAVAAQNKKLTESIELMEEELVQMDRTEEKFMESNSPHNKQAAQRAAAKKIVAKVDSRVETHPDIIKIQDAHKLTIKDMQRNIDTFQENKRLLARNLREKRSDLLKQKTALREKYKTTLQNAQFTGYASIGILAVLTLIAFACTKRYV